jgi:hypothetical protein
MCGRQTLVMWWARGAHNLDLAFTCRNYIVSSLGLARHGDGPRIHVIQNRSHGYRMVGKTNLEAVLLRHVKGARLIETHSRSPLTVRAPLACIGNLLSPARHLNQPDSKCY